MAFSADRYFWWWEDFSLSQPFHPPAADYTLSLFGNPLMLWGSPLTLQRP